MSQFIAHLSSGSPVHLFARLHYCICSSTAALSIDLDLGLHVAIRHTIDRSIYLPLINFSIIESSVWPTPLTTFELLSNHVYCRDGIPRPLNVTNDVSTYWRDSQTFVLTFLSFLDEKLRGLVVTNVPINIYIITLRSSIVAKRDIVFIGVCLSVCLHNTEKLLIRI